MSHSKQRTWRVHDEKSKPNPSESSLSPSQSESSNLSNLRIVNTNIIITDYDTSRTSSSSCCWDDSLGSKLGLSQSSSNYYKRQQCFALLQSLFTKKHLLNYLVTPCFAAVQPHHFLGAAAAPFMASPFMASPVARELSPARNKKLLGQLKREALEREVSMLQNTLHEEERVHQVLNHIHNNQPNASPMPIPNFLPPKTKELLAELAMVEGEIAKLEGQIGQLQLGLKHEKETSDASKAKQWRYGSPIRSVCSPSSFTFPTPTQNGAQNGRAGFEAKSLHFISKAIKGDFSPREFTASDRRGNFKAFGEKENYFYEEKVHEKVPKRSGILKPSSPMRDHRNPSPKPTRNPGISSDTPQKPISMTVSSEEKIQNWHPNKLSEEIMKCLNFIYIRLLRTTRQMELEKSGPTTRSLNPSLSSRNFRVEAGSNSKESRQQDPYGIFDEEECLPRDIGPYKNLVIFTASSMDPKCVSSPSSSPLLRKLRLLMNNLQTVELKSLTYPQKLAFWINMYNACIMHGYLQYGVPSTPDKLLTLIDKAMLNIGGNIINAQAIEHFILRKPQPPNPTDGENGEKEAVVRGLYGLDTAEPNVTFALCCGTRSSPAVRTYTAEGVAAELERSKVEYLQASVTVTASKKIALPELLLRNALDFAASGELLIEWLCHSLPTSGTLRKSIVDCFRNSGTISPEKLDYDYEFQYILAL